ncbi:hypothetical protein B296_00030716 [Ensete ventricosum]|uniref:Uncharacterized protein n=1 Tax=Ensete ventricosum TaxID=4639 RepID=A0A426Y0M0_ENSVE|nr:hypothetical protein B296_00030716 [Ensete ventricosum]
MSLCDLNDDDNLHNPHCSWYVNIRGLSGVHVQATADWSLEIFASAIRDRGREADETRGVERAREDTEARGELRPDVALLE